MVSFVVVCCRVGRLTPGTELLQGSASCLRRARHSHSRQAHGGAVAGQSAIGMNPDKTQRHTTVFIHSVRGETE